MSEQKKSLVEDDEITLSKAKTIDQITPNVKSSDSPVMQRIHSTSDKQSRKSVFKAHKKVDSYDKINELQKYNKQPTKHKSEQKLFRPEFRYQKGGRQVDDQFNAKLWELMSVYLGHERWSIQKQIVNHVEYTVAKSRFHFDKSHLSMAGNDPKRVYYLSAEYLQGRMMQNTLVNLNLVDQYRDSLMDIGYKLEDLYEHELDLGLGTGGLGRLAACFLDSLATLEIPAWGYGIRYHYGNFKQHLIEELGKQIEIPNFGYSKKIPWEIQRYDVVYPVKLYGELKKEMIEKNGLQMEKTTWQKAEIVKAMAYDTPVIGYNTFNCNCLRLWSALPSFEPSSKEYHCQTDDDYINLVKARQRAEKITSIMFFRGGNMSPQVHEHIIKQQYFFCAATIKDIVRRFQKIHHKNFEQFPNKIGIQLNDAHPAIAIIELMRILIDEEELTMHQAWLITCNTFAYTSHSTGTEFLEKWDVNIVAKILPRHMELIHYINFFFLEKVKKDYPGDKNRLGRMSIIEIQPDNQQKIRMAYICFLASHKVNGVSMEHTNILRQLVFRDFNEMYPDRIISITNGVSQRRWIQCANSGLAKIITLCLGDEEWLINLNLLSQLNAWKYDHGFIHSYQQVRRDNKKRLIEYLIKNDKSNSNLTEFTKNFIIGTEDIMIDVMAKRIAGVKRQILYLFYILLRYLKIKENPKSQGHIGKVIYIVSGRSAPNQTEGKKMIELIFRIMHMVNSDQQASNFMKICFVPNFNVALCELFVSAADVSQHISTPGTEPSGTSNMKFIMNGGLIVGSRDGANLEIEKELGQQNTFLFGSDKNKLFAYQKFLKHMPQGVSHIDFSLRKVFDFCYSNINDGFKYICHTLITELEMAKDPYGICLDFVSYTQAMDEASKVYFAPKKAMIESPIAARVHAFEEGDWIIRSINCIAGSGRFSSDRTISEYCDEIWSVQDMSIPKGSVTPVERLRSFPHVTAEEKMRAKMNTTQAPQSFIKK